MDDLYSRSPLQMTNTVEEGTIFLNPTLLTEPHDYQFG